MEIYKIISASLLIVAYHSSYAQIDQKATKGTKALYANLLKVNKTGVLFGQQDALAYGLEKDGSRWTEQSTRCDVKTVLGDFPAVIGHDLGKIEFDSIYNLDGVPFASIRKYVIETYKRGGVNTISWHLNNPVMANKTSWDKADSTIKFLFSDSMAIDRYKNWLNKVADFAESLTSKNGKKIPFIFRPFHEHNGSWFWWGANQCTPHEYKILWRFTVNYLKTERQIHNILYAYSTDAFKTEAEYLERYPGDEWVDILGFDSYHRDAPQSTVKFKTDMIKMVNTVAILSRKKNKPCAITEVGLEMITEPQWWTQTLLPIIKNSNLSYVLLWRNGRPDHYYTPFEGHKSVPDFRKFYENGHTLFNKDVKRKLYW